MLRRPPTRTASRPRRPPGHPTSTASPCAPGPALRWVVATAPRAPPLRRPMTSLESAARSARLADVPWQASAPVGTFFKGTGRSLREIYGQRELLRLLVQRELKSRYKDSSLGFLWSLL